MSMSEQGDGYIVVTRDDGSSFGQNVRGCKAQTANEMDEFVMSLVDEIDAREAHTQKKIPANVLAAVRAERPLQRRP
jgi:hypothetical protein